MLFFLYKTYIFAFVSKSAFSTLCEWMDSKAKCRELVATIFDKKTSCQYWVFCLDRSSTGEVNFVRYEFRIDIRFSVLICAPFQYWYSSGFFEVCMVDKLETSTGCLFSDYFFMKIFESKPFQFVIKLLFDYYILRNLLLYSF